MLDFVLILTFIYLLVAGFYYGLAASTIRFIGVIIGIYLSLIFFKPIAFFMNKYLHTNETLVEFLSVFFIFSSIIILSFMFKVLVKDKVEENYKIKIIDKIVGGLFGLFLYIFILYALIKYSNEGSIIYDLTSQSKIIMTLKDWIEK